MIQEAWKVAFPSLRFPLEWIAVCPQQAIILLGVCSTKSMSTCQGHIGLGSIVTVSGSKLLPNIY
jgi:hypothetical protein